METPQVNRKQIDDLRAWFFAKDRSISLAQSCLYYLFSGGQANGAYMSHAFIAETVLSADAASVTFSGIPQNFRHLMIFAQFRSSVAGEADNGTIRFNNDSGTNYDFIQLQAQSATASVSTARATSGSVLFRGEGANARAFNFGPNFGIIYNYSVNTIEKSAIAFTLQMGDVSADTDVVMQMRAIRWRNKNVITSLVLLPETGPNFVTGSRFQLYGIL